MFDFDFSAYIASFLSLSSFYLLALVSPGPDVALTIRNSLLHSRKVGIAGAIGTATGILIHLTYTVFGIGYIVSEMPIVMTGIRIAGALYLIYLGYLSFRTDGDMSDYDVKKDAVTKATLTPWKAYRIGVLNNLLNPMVILLFITILSAYITPETPLVVQGIYGTIMVGLAFSWFAFVAVFFSVDAIRNQFLKLGKWLERITGGALIAFGVKVGYLATKAF